ncbi:hypothetical protein ACIA5D_36910 [Actinoplanes sp. NPDC051513]|uniref:hypothetical protein n=1 Tax=Actinoplanes sp. NPDC051513 TaxID=3363908 RepID=UPI0037AFBDFE
MASPLDDALRRTADAVTRYQAPEAMVAVAARSLTKLPCQRRARIEVDALHDAIRRLRHLPRHP